MSLNVAALLLVTGFVAGDTSPTRRGPHCCAAGVCPWQRDACTCTTDLKPHRTVFQKLWPSPPPAPPGLMESSILCYLPAILLVWVTAFAMTWLFGISTGIIAQVTISPTHLWLIYPCTQSYLALAYWSLGPLLGTTSSASLGPTDRTISQGVFGTFLALVMQGSLSYLLTAVGPKRKLAHIVHPPTAVYGVACAYYGYKTLGAPPVVESDVFGLPMQPLHLFLWMCSTASQCVLVRSTCA